MQASLAILVLAAAAVHTFWPREPRTEIGEVAGAHMRFARACSDGDYELVWELSSVELRRGFEEQLKEAGFDASREARDRFVSGLESHAEA